MMDGISRTIIEDGKATTYCDGEEYHIYEVIEENKPVTMVDGGGTERIGIQQVSRCTLCKCVMRKTRFDDWTVKSPKTPTQLWKELGIDYNPVLKND